MKLLNMTVFNKFNWVREFRPEFAIQNMFLCTESDAICGDVIEGVSNAK